MRRPRLALLAALAALTPAVGGATTLDEAIASALKHDGGLQRAAAEHDAAKARVTEAEAGRLPSVTLQASAAEAPTAFGHFFGFPDQTLTPRTAGIELRQLVFNGGGANAAVRAARAGEAGAADAVVGARLGLIADVAAAFEDVRVADETVRLQQHQAEELGVVAQQAARRFQDGEVPKTDVDQAAARLAGAKADLARADGDLAVAQARYVELVGEAPGALEPPTSLPAAPADIDEAVSEAEARNPGLAAAQAAVTAADEALRQAKAERAPRVDLVAGGSTIRDEFFPGYRADSASIGVEGRWTLFSGGLVAGKINEAAAGRGAAEAALSQSRDAVREAAVEAWHGLVTTRSVAAAADAEATAAEAALASVREEVRVGEKPTLDLLDAEREALADRLAALRADAGVVIAAYRLKAVIGDDR
jgi:TolC family type I secretion outer membrane protein